MAFEGLTEKISATFKKLRGKGRLKEADVKEAMREIRMALLEADVSYKVVKDFTKSVTERCVGTDVLESLTPAQMIVKLQRHVIDGKHGVVHAVAKVAGAVVHRDGHFLNRADLAVVVRNILHERFLLSC